ncbi:MAG TPA: HypC/HybG/HupF family hydrogenase formation chaperone [Ktedonobacteraceae bacterium]|nr:HypC/HybG/HupF family hydrogenase formation chaperone [Ktedonobacteraceae bacterium]
MQCSDERCLTCADVLFSGRVVSLSEEKDIALVEIDHQLQEVDISLVDQVRPGDRLLIHGGVALACQEAGLPGASAGASTENL